MKKINKIKETKEEYLKKTNIKNKEEAQEYLAQLKILFWIVFLGSPLVQVLNNEIGDLLSILYLGLLIYFIYFCVKVLKAEKLPRTNALLCIFFAPISWIWLYPLVTDPLKIILGQKKVPIPLSNKEKQLMKTRINKNFWRSILIAVGITFGFFISILILILLLT